LNICSLHKNAGHLYVSVGHNVSRMLPIILQYVCAGGTLRVYTQILFSSFLCHLCNGRSCSAVNSAPVDDVTDITWRQPEMASFTTSLMPLTMLSLLASNLAGIQLSAYCCLM